MKPPTLRARRLSMFFVGAVLVAMLPTTGVQAAPPTAPGDRGFGKHDRELLATARAEGDATVTLLVAAKAGSAGQVASGVAALGGTVKYREDTIGYLRVVVATDKAEKVASLSGVEAVDVDETIPVEDPTPGPEGQVPPTPQPAPGSSTPSVNPYMPTGDTGTAQFVQAHPTWDGRGVTVGVIDLGIDLDHPALSTTSTGKRKIVDWITATAPTFTDGRNDDNDPTWLNMTTQVSASPTFVQGTTTYTAPAVASYRFAVFNERDSRLGGEVGSDVNRDGNPTGSSGLFPVLWETTTNLVYVDVNQNNSFADDPGMTDFKVNHDVRYFGTDNTNTAIHEAMPFVVQTDLGNEAVNIGIVSGAHGSHVAGILAGNNVFGGEADGAAPGAQLVSVRACLFIAGCTAHALIEGMVYAAKQAHVDVINMSIGGLPALNDGNNTRAVLYNRLIDTYNVQMFISAGNSGAGMNTVGDPSVASKVVSVGSYITRATWQSNYGSDSAYDDNLHPYSSRGPREDGGFKPQVVAPGSAISTVPTWQDGQPVPGTYALPPGLAMFNGTSMASPQAAGTAAVLVSAAKVTGAQDQPAQLRKAMLSSARFLDPDRIGAFEQGNGLVNAGAAWNLLKTNLKTVEIEAAVSTHTVLSGFLAKPGVGTGIYDREGVNVGESYSRTYTLKRNSGPGGSVTYNLSWVGEDGTFSSAGSVTLPKGSNVELPVQVHVSSEGAHSAVLNFDDPSSPGIEFQTLNTVVAPYTFDSDQGYSQSFTSSIGRNQAKSYFFRVPADVPVPALKVDFTGPDGTPGTGQARFVRFHPYGVPFESGTVNSLFCYSPPVAGGSCTGGTPSSRTAANPTAGVWEVSVEARRTSDVDPVPFTLTASILGASVAPNPDVIASATLGVPVERSYTLTNLFGAFTGRAEGTTLGSARRGTFTIANLAQQQYPVTVTPGSTSLRATIGNPSDLKADLDLFVYNCTSGSCVLAGQSADGDSEESVTVNNPAAGTWVVLVDGYAVPSGSTTYDYVDVFVNPAFGTIAVTDANALRPAGSSWIVPATVTANAAPATGRVLLGNVQVRTDADVLIGQGDVVVNSVGVGP